MYSVQCPFKGGASLKSLSNIIAIIICITLFISCIPLAKSQACVQGNTVLSLANGVSMDAQVCSQSEQFFQYTVCTATDDIFTVTVFESFGKVLVQVFNLDGSAIVGMQSTYTPGIVGKWQLTVPASQTRTMFAVKVTGVQVGTNTLTSTFKITATTNSPLLLAGGGPISLVIPGNCYRYFQTVTQLPISRFEMHVSNVAFPLMTDASSSKTFQLFVSDVSTVPSSSQSAWKNTNLLVNPSLVTDSSNIRTITYGFLCSQCGNGGTVNFSLKIAGVVKLSYGITSPDKIDSGYTRAFQIDRSSSCEAGEVIKLKSNVNLGAVLISRTPFPTDALCDIHTNNAGFGCWNNGNVKINTTNPITHIINPVIYGAPLYALLYKNATLPSTGTAAMNITYTNIKPVICSVAPNMAPVNGGKSQQTHVIITGREFTPVSSMVCRFGAVTDGNAGSRLDIITYRNPVASVNATYISPTQISCPVPAGCRGKKDIEKYECSLYSTVGKNCQKATFIANMCPCITYDRSQCLTSNLIIDITTGSNPSSLLFAKSTNAKVKVPFNAPSSVLASAFSGSFTIEVWVYNTGCNVIECAIFQTNDVVVTNQLGLSVKSLQDLYLLLQGQFSPTGAQMIQGQWIFVALRVDTKNKLLDIRWINQNSFLTPVSKSFNTLPAFTGQLIVGGVASTDESSFGGMLDEFRVWNTYRSNSQIDASYNYIQPSLTPNLLLYLSMNELRGTVLFDQSGNQLDGGMATGTSIIQPTFHLSGTIATQPLFMSNNPGLSAVIIEVSNNGYIWSNSSTPFYYYHNSVIINSIVPSASPLTSSSSLVVTGSGFRPSQFAVCQFGSKVVSAVVQSFSQLTCTAPPTTTAGQLSFSVSLNGQSYSAANVYRYYTQDMMGNITSVVPPIGSAIGGTTIRILGFGFTYFYPNKIMCQFGTLPPVEAIDATSTYVSCVSPKLVPGIAFPVEVSMNNQHYTSFGKTYSAFDFNLFKITSINPTFGPASGNTLITVRGSGFSLSSIGTCKFGTILVPLTFNNVTTTSSTLIPSSSTTTTTTSTISSLVLISCISGTRMDTKTNSAEGGLTTATTVTTVLANCSLQKITTTVVVTIAAYNKPVYSYDVFLTCLSPKLEVTKTFAVDFTASLNNANFYSPSLQFTYFVSATVTSVTPNMSPISGGTVVSIPGTNYLVTPFGVQCRFGTMLTDGKISSNNPNLITCTTPAVATPGLYTVELTFNGVQYTNSSVQFQYFDVPTAFNLSPNAGPISGSTLVTINGKNFLSNTQMKCQFGTSSPIIAVFISSTQIQCVSPATASPVQSELFLTMNNQQYQSLGQSFTTYLDPVLQLISPKSGGINGGQAVTISGFNLLNTPFIRCLFTSTTPSKSVIVPGQMTSAGVTCVTPSMSPYTPIVTVSISLNNQQYSKSSLHFIYYGTPISISTLSPSQSPISTTSLVRIAGANFTETGEIKCRFGFNYVNFSLIPRLVSGTYNANLKVIECQTPVINSVLSIPLDIALNGKDFSGNPVSYDFFDQSAVRVSSIYPSTSYIQGGTQLIISGQNFVQSNSILVEFGDPSNVVKGTFVPYSSLSSKNRRRLLQSASSTGVIVCNSPKPKGTQSSVVVSIAVDGQHFIPVGSISFYNDPQVFGLTPSSGPISGGTIVTVTGRNFIKSSTMFCSFNGVVSPTQATFISSTTMICVSPAMPSAASIPVTGAPVTVSFDGQKFFPVSGDTQRNMLFYVGRPIVSIEPNSGSVTGGDVIIVKSTASAGTSFFSNGNAYFCMFGTVKVPANYMPVSGFVNCTTPTYGIAGPVTFQLTLNDQQWFGSLTFTYNAIPDCLTCADSSAPRGYKGLSESGTMVVYRESLTKSIYSKAIANAKSKAKSLKTSVTKKAG